MTCWERYVGKGAMGGRGGGRQAACLPTFLLYHSLKWLGPLEGDLGERRERERRGRGVGEEGERRGRGVGEEGERSGRGVGEEWERRGRGVGEEGERRGREVRRGG